MARRGWSTTDRPSRGPGEQRTRDERFGTAVFLERFCEMNDGKIHNKPSAVLPHDGVVELKGPDHVDVTLSADAAMETSQRLFDAAAEAHGQLRMKEIRQRKPI
jgi:hypothetical protein